MGTKHPNKENMGQQTKFLHSCCSTVRLKCCKPVICKISWVFKGIFITIKKKTNMHRILLQKNPYFQLFCVSATATQWPSYTPASDERTCSIRQGTEQGPNWGLAPELTDKSQWQLAITRRSTYSLSNLEGKWRRTILFCWIKVILLQAAAGQAIDISWGQKKTNGLQKQTRERLSPIFLTVIITIQLEKRRKSQGKVWEYAVTFTLITKIQIRIPQRGWMLDQDRLSSPKEVTKEGEQRPF